MFLIFIFRSSWELTNINYCYCNCCLCFKIGGFGLLKLKIEENVGKRRKLLQMKRVLDRSWRRWRVQRLDMPSSFPVSIFQCVNWYLHEFFFVNWWLNSTICDIILEIHQYSFGLVYNELKQNDSLNFLNFFKDRCCNSSSRSFEYNLSIINRGKVAYIQPPYPFVREPC